MWDKGGIEASDFFALLSTGDEQLRVKYSENPGQRASVSLVSDKASGSRPTSVQDSTRLAEPQRH